MKLACLLLLAATAACAQLPAGTTDTTKAPPPDPLFAQAESALEQQDFTAALPLLTKLAADHPDDAAILFDLGYAQDGLNHSAEAETSYRKALQIKPDYPEAHLALGLLLAAAGQNAIAHSQLLAAITQNADPRVRAATDRAMAQLDLQTNPSKAQDELLDALKLSPETPSDTLMTADLAAGAGDNAGAEREYRRYLEKQPDDAQAVASLAHALLRQQKAADAEPLLTSALTKHPGDPGLSAQLVAVYLAENKTDQALPLAEGLHTAHPQDANIDRMLAHLYDQLRQPEKSEPLYAALSAQSPKDLTLIDEHAAALIQLHHPAEAEALLKKAVTDPDAFPSREQFGIAASHLAFAASENDDPTTTLQALSLRAKVLPQSASSLYLQATATDRLHRSKEAADLYRQFLAIANGKYPDEEAEAQKRLTALGHPR